jgi:zinc D-Ala-D-Ala carboxypeptidase
MSTIMGNLSEHYSNRDFFCSCEECGKSNEFKVHLGLVGALEMLAVALGKTPRILSSYRCEAVNEKLGGGRKSFHLRGKAAHIYVEGMAAVELFKKCREIPEIKGLGLNLEEKTVHIDLRPEENRVEWVKENGQYIILTPEKLQKYGLQ